MGYIVRPCLKKKKKKTKDHRWGRGLELQIIVTSVLHMGKLRPREVHNVEIELATMTLEGRNQAGVGKEWNEAGKGGL
jgi:hypothetical protein